MNPTISFKAVNTPVLARVSGSGNVVCLVAKTPASLNTVREIKRRAIELFGGDRRVLIRTLD